MKDWENRRPETVEDLSDQLVEFAAEFEFDTPEHYAVCNFLNLQQLYIELGDEPQPHRYVVSGEKNLSAEERRNLIVQKIALLEHTIDQNHAHIPGYAKTYGHMVGSFDDLMSVAADEAKEKYYDEEKLKAYVREIYDRTIDLMNTDVYQKQNPS
jgi:hypothetical protein